MTRTKTKTKRRKQDNYPTPGALCSRIVRAVLPTTFDGEVLEPSAGVGNFSIAVDQNTTAKRIVSLEPNKARWKRLELRTRGFRRHEVVKTTLELFNNGEDLRCFDLAIGNPPFSHQLEHAKLLIGNVESVALLLRLSFLGSQERWLDFWSLPRMAHDLRLLVLSQRPSFTNKGTDNSEYAVFMWGPLFASRPFITHLPPS